MVTRDKEGKPKSLLLLSLTDNDDGQEDAMFD